MCATLFFFADQPRGVQLYIVLCLRLSKAAVSENSAFFVAGGMSRRGKEPIALFGVQYCVPCYLYADKKQIEDFFVSRFSSQPFGPLIKVKDLLRNSGSSSHFLCLYQQRQEYTAPAACFRDSRKFLSVD